MSGGSLSSPRIFSLARDMSPCAPDVLYSQSMLNTAIAAMGTDSARSVS